MNSIISLKNISKVYPMGEIKVSALNNVTLEIKRNEFVAIVGPSGSGKSTLMHIIGLLDVPTKGEVYLLNKNISRLNANEQAELRNRHIGFIFQAYNLLARTSAIDNVEMPLIYSGIKRNNRVSKALKVLELVGLKERINHLPSQLSGGQQQRVAIARALVNKPDLILADEPTGNLDSKSGKEILELMIKLNKQGNTVVLVTHDLTIASFTKRIIEIKDGKIVKDHKND
jgi:putative ABC transport system ATP-binding protein